MGENMEVKCPSQSLNFHMESMLQLPTKEVQPKIIMERAAGLPTEYQTLMPTICNVGLLVLLCLLQ